MIKKLKASGLAAFGLVALFVAQAATAELVIIVHPSNPTTKMSRSEVSDLYLGRSDSFGDGASAEPVEQGAPSDARNIFLRKVLVMDEAKLKSHWAKLMFSGKGEPPRMVTGDAEVREWVAANPHAIGYIDSSAVTSGVKIVLSIP